MPRENKKPARASARAGVSCTQLWILEIGGREIAAVRTTTNMHVSEADEAVGVDRRGLIGRVGDGVNQGQADAQLVAAQAGLGDQVLITPESVGTTGNVGGGERN